MKTLSTVAIFLLLCTGAIAQENKAVFLHHSTGAGVFSEGNVEAWLTDYNSQHGTSFEINAPSYPDSPWPWKNYPYDYWKLWVDGDCDNAEAGIECLESIASKYELVIFKHCYPGAAIKEDEGEGDITSKNKTLTNYKLQYRALRDKMDAMPNTKFLIWTLAPLHRLSTNSDDAARAKEFVDWVLNDFLTEDGKEHPNIFFFDFFGAVAEQSVSPENGQQYCLKYEFEDSHTDGNSHPNTPANKHAGPLFGQAIVDAFEGKTSSGNPGGTSALQNAAPTIMDVYPNPTPGHVYIAVPGDHPDDNLQVSVVSLAGKTLANETVANNSYAHLSGLKPGAYILHIHSSAKLYSSKILIH